MRVPLATRLLQYAAALLFIGAWDLAAPLAPWVARLGPAARWGWLAGATALILGLGAFRTRQLRLENQRLRAVDALGSAMGRRQRLDQAARTLLRAVGRLVGSDAGCVRMFDSAGRLALVGCLGASPRYARARALVPVESGPVRAALDREEPVYARRLPADSELLELLPEGRAALAVPLCDGDRIVGILSLVFKRPRRLPGSRLAMAAALGERAGEWLTTIRLLEELVQAAHTDPLTGLSSRRHFEEIFRRECARAHRNERPLALALMDLDHFKAINDNFGHALADRALMSAAAALRNARAYDVAARFGGDEFVLLMPETSEIEAASVVERIRGAVAALNDRQEFPFPVHLSIGVAASASPTMDLLAQADAAMYRDKERYRRQTFAPSSRVAATGGVLRREAS